MSLVGALTKALKAGETAKKTAPFYSAVDEALANLKRPKGTGAEFLTEVMKTKGVKPAEIADRKLEQAFKAKGKMTKEEAQQVLKENPPPKLSERVMEEMDDYAREERYRELMENQGYEKYNEVPVSTRQRFNDEIDAEDVQHAAHRLPGGSNYREILLKLPKQFSDQDSRRLMSLEADLRRGELPANKMQELTELQAKKQNTQEPYYSSHYTQDPNVLAHMRVIDREGPNGEKILHVEEIQSDWHQQGRKKGYREQGQSERLKGEPYKLDDGTFGVKWEDGSVSDLGWGRDHAERLAAEGKLTETVPDAPFKKNWHELAMKRLLNYAADNGYDSIAITPGMEQAKRWNNEALKVHYDQKIPQFLNEFGKPYGVEIGQMPFDKGGYKVNADKYPLPYRLEAEGSPDIISRFATAEEAWKEAERLGNLPLHSFKITPEMRESIKQKGLPLYQQIGIPTAGAGAASQVPEHEEGLATGGAIAKLARKAAPAPKSPQIIKPSTLTELKKIVEQEKGGYGVRRLERAADEIPNLEKLYSERGLREAFTGDNARALMTMNPADFEKFAMPLVVKTDQYLSTPVLNSRIKARTADKLDMPTDEYVKYLMDIDRFDDVPFLTINKEEQGLPLMPFISGHEGRHRNRSLASRGEQAGLVQLLPRAELREPFPRRSQEQYIEALKEELGMTGNKVEPEKYRLDLGGYDSDFIRRPPIDLPDIYAKGGAVKRQVKKADGGAINYNTAPDMSDGGRIIQGAPFKRGGKVNISTNRDAMFMELSNKKLKRK